MNRKHVLIGFIVMAAVGLAALPASAQNSSQRVIVTHDGNMNDATIADVGGTVVGSINSNSFVVNVPVGKIAKLRAHASVSRVEEDAAVYANAQTTPWGVSQIGANQVWGVTTGAGVRVAIVDTGISANHPDLAGRVILGPSYVNGARTSNDDNGHGSHCAGIAGASNNTIGVVGVAPSVQFLAIKVLSKNGSGWTSGIITGIDYASNPSQGNARVINLSLGSSSDVQSLHDAVDRAVNDRGVVVCAASGNDGNTSNAVSYPGAYASAICVAATDSNDARAYFSTYGAQVDVAAPGVSIYSTYKGSAYATLNGTSMATPHVCGEAALLIASGLIVDRNGNGFNNDEVRTRIESTSTLYSSRTDALGYGRISALAAINAGSN